jgi:hypothetical protein
MKRLLFALIAAVALAGCGHPTPPPGAHSGHRPAVNSVSPTRRLKATVPVSVPAQPAGPSGSYKVVFADGFGALGAWKLESTKSGSRGCCNNSNEIGDMVLAKAVQTPGLLELRCAHETSPLGRPYSCSGVESNFRWKPGQGQTMVFEVEAQWPSNSGEGQDPGWWSTDTSWTDEIDFFEAWGWNHAEYYAGIPCWLPKAGGGSDYCHEIYKASSELNGPATSFHRYTTVVKPNGEAEEYVDSSHRWNLGPISGINTPWMHLILTHAMRSSSTSSSSVFSIKRVEVWEDEAHAGQFLENAGVAAGTTIAGSEPTPEPTPTTTETTPTPPPASAPATPTNPTVTASTEAISISWGPSTGASGYHLYRTGPWPSWVPVGSAWTTQTGTSAVNKSEVVSGREYCFRVSAYNSSGTSALTAPVCVKAR